MNTPERTTANDVEIALLLMAQEIIKTEGFNGISELDTADPFEVIRKFINAVERVQKGKNSGS